MNPLTRNEIARGIARRCLPSGSWIAYEVCGDCNDVFDKGAGKLGYGFSNIAKDLRGGTRHPNGHDEDGRGRCRPCLEKRGVFSSAGFAKPNLRDLVLAGMSKRGSYPEKLAKQIGRSTVDVREELLRLVDEGRAWTKGKLYGKIECEAEEER